MICHIRPPVFQTNLKKKNLFCLLDYLKLEIVYTIKMNKLQGST